MNTKMIKSFEWLAILEKVKYFVSAVVAATTSAAAGAATGAVAATEALRAPL